MCFCKYQPSTVSTSQFCLRFNWYHMSSSLSNFIQYQNTHTDKKKTAMCNMRSTTDKVHLKNRCINCLNFLLWKNCLKYLCFSPLLALWTKEEQINFTWRRGNKDWRVDIENKLASLYIRGIRKPSKLAVTVIHIQGCNACKGFCLPFYDDETLRQTLSVS